MRIWDLPPSLLCRNHLLGEHRELHAVWSILTGGRKGYAHHPETLRWRGKTGALYKRHEVLVEELQKRGYTHRSPLDENLAAGKFRQTRRIDSLEEQKRRLRDKRCGCRV